MAANGTPSDQPQNSGQKSTNAPLPRIEIKNADRVQQSLAGGINWMEDNAKLVVALLVIVILGALGYAGLNWIGVRQERRAQEDYYSVESRYTKIKDGFDRAKFKDLMPAGAQNQPATPATGDLAKDYGDVVTQLENLAKERAGTSAGAQAGLLAADTYLTYKQPDKAIEISQVAANKLKADHPLQQLSQMMWGNALAAKGDCQAAVGVWQQVLTNDKAQYLHPDASLRSGLCFEKLGRTDSAMEMYRKASAAGESAAGQTARGFLRALEVKGKSAAPQAASNG